MKITKEIEDWLNEVVEGDWYDTPRGINIKGNVYIPEHYTEIPIQFNVVDGNFNCWSTDLTSLKNGPRAVGGNFSCSCTKITSLKYSPKEVGGGFYCYRTNITSLLYGPQEVHGNFHCYHTNISSLQYAPMYIGGTLFCGYTNIKGKPDISHIDLKGILYWKY